MQVTGVTDRGLKARPMRTVAVLGGGRAGLVAEANAFATAARLDVHQALVHIFFAQRSTKKVRLGLVADLLSDLVAEANAFATAARLDVGWMSTRRWCTSSLRSAPPRRCGVAKMAGASCCVFVINSLRCTNQEGAPLSGC